MTSLTHFDESHTSILSEISYGGISHHMNDLVKKKLHCLDTRLLGVLCLGE